MSHCFLLLDKHESALDVLKRGSLRKRKLTEDLLYLHYNIGLAYEGIGDIKNALKHFKKVYSANVSFEDVADRLNSLE